MAISQQRYGMAVLMITHDLNLVRKFADRVAVMEDGWLVEQGSVANVFGNPQDPYTRKLIESRPAREIEEAPHKSLEPVMRASELRVKYPILHSGNPRLNQERGVRRGEERRLYMSRGGPWVSWVNRAQANPRWRSPRWG